MKIVVLSVAKALVHFGYSILTAIDDQLFVIEWGKTRQQILTEAVLGSIPTIKAKDAKIQWNTAHPKKKDSGVN